MIRALAIISLLLLAQCATNREHRGEGPTYDDFGHQPRRQTRKKTRPQTSKPKPKFTIPDEKIDVARLQRVLRMERGKRELGVKTKRFNTCKVGAGYYSKGYCRKHYLSVVHFRTRCRATTGTVEEVNRYELSPMINNNLTFMVAGKTGETRTDYEGYGQAVFVTTKNPRRERFILRTGSHNLGLRVAGVREVILPSDWCD